MSRTLDYLFDQNVECAHRKTRLDPSFFRRVAEQQAPRFLWLGCSDSCVPTNDILGMDPGEIFVHRNIANMVHTSDMNILSVLEFAVDHLKVEHVVVCGHYGCGGVQQATACTRGSMLDHWLQPLTMMYHKHRSRIDAITSEPTRLDRLCEINVEMQVRRIAATPIIENAWTRGQAMHVHGWIYAIHDGLLRDLGPHLASIAERDALPSIDHRVVDPVEPISAMRRQAMAFAAGIAGYHYQQVTGDSGAGAVLGPFKGEVSAIGPNLTYNFQVGAVRVLTSVRWLHEFNAKNRLAGDAGFITVTIPLGGAPAH